jgi:uncharacterized HAD superfamily protein
VKIGFDIDGVIYDFHKAVYPALRVMSLTARDYIRFWTCEVNGDHDVNRENWAWLSSEAGLFCNPPIDLVVPYLQKLNERHQLYYVTSRDPELEAFTHEWFREHAIPYAEIIFAADKRPHMKDLVWFVEDNPDNAKILNDHTQVILIRKDWNWHLRSMFPMYDHITQIKEF